MKINRLVACPPAARSAPAQQGFTLIELMIAVAIISILAAVALPQYNGAMRKSRRTEAFSSLSAVQQAEERWRTNNPSYTTDQTATGLNLALPAAGYYSVVIDAATNTGYTVTATAVSGKSQADDGNCVRLRVRAAAGNTFYGSAPATGTTFDESTSNRCWNR